MGIAPLELKKLELEGACLVRGQRHRDARGFFEESWNASDYAALGLSAAFVQDNLSYSAQPGTVRGLHFQVGLAAQTRLLRVLKGRIFDVLVRLPPSPQAYTWIALELSEDDEFNLWIPKGFAHGFCTLEPDTLVSYKVDVPYTPASEGGIFWADPRLNIPWPVPPQQAIVSERDARLPLLEPR
jgi:dTDP-4-dehydrorhamnose 3,5-epimerase